MAVKHTTITQKQKLVAKNDTYLGDDGKVYEEHCSGILIAREGQEIDQALLKRYPAVGEHFLGKPKAAPAPAAEKAEDPKPDNKSETPAAENKTAPAAKPKAKPKRTTRKPKK